MAQRMHRNQDTLQKSVLRKSFQSIISVSVLIAPLVGVIPGAIADTIRTPISTSVTVQGNSGGNQSSQCGFISRSPNHRLIVTEPLVSLRFTLEGSGEPTIVIQNEQGRRECVMADQLSSGTIELPGAWEEGRYDIFIGDRTGNSHNYTLVIDQER